MKKLVRKIIFHTIVSKWTLKKFGSSAYLLIEISLIKSTINFFHSIYLLLDAHFFAIFFCRENKVQVLKIKFEFIAFSRRKNKIEIWWNVIPTGILFIRVLENRRFFFLHFYYYNFRLKTAGENIQNYFFSHIIIGKLSRYFPRTTNGRSWRWKKMPTNSMKRILTLFVSETHRFKQSRRIYRQRRNYFYFLKLMIQNWLSVSAASSPSSFSKVFFLSSGASTLSRLLHKLLSTRHRDKNHTIPINLV